VVQALDVGQDGRPRGRQARHGLEVGIQRTAELGLAGDQVREGDEEGGQEPGEGNDEEAFPRANPFLSLCDPLEAPPGEDCREGGKHERPGCFPVAEGDTHRD
jgi:hypothetical protein